ncbi:MAG TPA: THUMP domain-containing protein [Castellaniella sp.]|nr:THUMP domain-containing protein [Castellaniella sp.]
MSDSPSNPRKTLTIQTRKTHKAPVTAGDKHESGRKKRSGGRARQVAIQERAHSQAPDAPETLRHSAPPKDRPLRDRVQAPQGIGRASQPPQPRSQPETRPSARPNRKAKQPSAQPDDGSADPKPHITRRPREPRRAEIFSVFAPCPQGLEEALALELHALGYEAVRQGRAGCHFQADWAGILRANLYSRLATRILVQVSQAEVHTEDDILALAYETPWERWFGAEQTLRVDTSAVRSPLRSLQYCNLRAKDGICDRLRDREGARPDIDTVRPDARVHLFLDARQATLYLDVSGESLFKRGWRLDKGEAPLRENLAAGLLALSDWTPDQPLLDPFCGSGTILIEAAWIALGVPAGIWRPFSFERLRNHDVRQWRDLKDDARAHIAPRLEQPLVGCDLDPGAIAAARNNLERAHLTPDSIRLEIADARQFLPPASQGWIVTNPPYGERMGEADSELWPQWASHLKQHYMGWQVNIITSDLDLPGRMRLKAHRRHPLHNGALDCRLFKFNMVADSYRSSK